MNIQLEQRVSESNSVMQKLGSPRKKIAKYLIVQNIQLPNHVIYPKIYYSNLNLAC